MLPCLWTSLIISSESSGGQNCNGGGGRAGRKDLQEEGAFGALDTCNFSCICCGITMLTGSALGLTIGRGGSAGFDFGPDLFCLPNGFGPFSALSSSPLSGAVQGTKSACMKSNSACASRGSYSVIDNFTFAR